VRYLSLGEVLILHQRILEQTGGSEGLRDLGGSKRVGHAAMETGGSPQL